MLEIISRSIIPKRIKLEFFFLYSTSIFCFLILPVNLVWGQTGILFGGLDNWNDIFTSENVVVKEGRKGFYDILLDDSYSTTQFDLEINFNPGEIYRSSQNYKLHLEKSKNPITLISKNEFVRGGGSGVLRGYDEIKLTPLPSSLLAPGKVWEDFTIEFWLYPVSLRDGEDIITWHGSRFTNNNYDGQKFTVQILNRRLEWKFQGFFINLADNSSLDVKITGLNALSPQFWQHHAVRFDANSGIIEYIVNGVPEALQYVTDNYKDDGTIYLPKVGKGLGNPIRIGSSFVGLMDEFKISDTIVTPLLSRYPKDKGILMTKVIDLEILNREIDRINILTSLPSDSKIICYYRMASIPFNPETHKLDIIDEYSDWTKFNPTDNLDSSSLLRYIQLMIQLHPSSDLSKSPIIHEIQINQQDKFKVKLN